MSNRLNQLLPDIVVKHKVEFIRFQRAGDNTRRAIDVIDGVHKQEEKAHLLGLDAKKAFDPISWPFLFPTMEQGNRCFDPFLPHSVALNLPSLSFFPSRPFSSLMA